MESITLKDVGLAAMIEYSAQPGNEKIFADSGLQPYHEAEVFKGLMKRLPLSELAERARYSHHGGEHSLPRHLAWHAASISLKELHLLKKAVETSWKADEYFSVKMSDFAQTYWHIVVTARIKEKDFRRAWDDIRRSVREADVINGELQKNTIRLLKDLAHAMEELKLIGSVLAGCGAHHFHADTRMPGLRFLLQLLPRGREHWATSVSNPQKLFAGRYEFKYEDALIFALGKYFAQERQKKRGLKVTRRLQKVVKAIA